MASLTGRHGWSHTPLAERWSRVRLTALTALQSGLAAAAAWFAADLLGHHSSFFAPITAVIVLGASAGQRLQRAIDSSSASRWVSSSAASSSR